MLYLCIGICIAGLPLAILLFYQGVQSKELKKQVAYYRKLEQESRYLTVWTLKKDLVAGDAIKKSDLKEISVQVRNGSHVSGMADRKAIVGKHVKTALKKGTLIQSDMIYEGEENRDDLRMKELSCLKLPQKLQENEYIDIRIGFPDGEDYIVVKHKRVLGLLVDEELQKTSGIRLELSEEEILRISAACIDVNAYKNTELYAIEYKADFQKAAKHYYPINQKVFDLLQWDPNVKKQSGFRGEERKRAILERNLKLYQREPDEIGFVEPETERSQPSDTTGLDGGSELELFE